ncbi:MAG: hypothetical protein MK052_10730, partial [Alphaproteobacteria bacterium]|nr:hypothetical protein [Alphaproteobacteria bacterium]
MTDNYSITDIKTGNGFDGNRVAIIAATNDAKPGSLESLTRFFHEQGFNAQLGYTGNEKHHVLRLNGLKSDRNLERLLKKDFPAWQEGQNIDERGTACHITVPEDLKFKSMDTSPAKQARGFVNTLKRNSTDISAAAYTAGNAGLIFSALYGKNKGENVEFLKLGAPACYTMASAFLYLLNKKRPEPRSVNDIWDDIAPQVLSEDFVPTKAEEKQLRKEGNAIVEHAWDFMKKHPWEVSGLMNMVGATAHSASSLMRGNYTEAMGALSTLTAMGITTFVPEKGMSNGRVHSDAYKSLNESLSINSVEAIDAHGPLVKPFFDAGHKILDWIHEKPLRAASFIQLAANSAYGAAALNKQDADGNRKTDWGLMVTSGTYITGNSFQALATKGKGPSFDDAVSIASNAICHQTDWREKDPEEMHRLVQRVAKGLSAQPEIGHSQKMLTAGIKERLERFEESGASNCDVIDGF